MIDPKELINLPYGEANQVLKDNNCWAKQKFKVRVVLSYYPEYETKIITIKAVDKLQAMIKAEKRFGFELLGEIEIIEDEE